jgi:hypothetical protein
MTDKTAIQINSELSEPRKTNQKDDAQRDFTFIHINKNAGCSIEDALGLKKAHKTAQVAREQIGSEQWQNQFTFSFVRNPWDRVVSQYHYRLTINKTNLASDKISFNDWVKLTYQNKDSVYYDKPLLFMQQIDWLVDADSTILVDFIGRFENLESDFRYVCKQINHPYNLLHLNSTIHDNYKQYYNDESVDIVRRYFINDIRIFNYMF